MSQVFVYQKLWANIFHDRYRLKSDIDTIDDQVWAALPALLKKINLRSVRKVPLVVFGKIHLSPIRIERSCHSLIARALARQGIEEKHESSGGKKP